MIYISLFFLSFLAATIIPFSSEVGLASLLKLNLYNDLFLLISASSGKYILHDSELVLQGFTQELSKKRNGSRLKKVKHLAGLKNWTSGPYCYLGYRVSRPNYIYPAMKMNL